MCRILGSCLQIQKYELVEPGKWNKLTGISLVETSDVLQGEIAGHEASNSKIPHDRELSFNHPWRTSAQPQPAAPDEPFSDMPLARYGNHHPVLFRPARFFLEPSVMLITTRRINPRRTRMDP